MAEVLKFSKNIASARVDTSRPRSTGLSELGKLIGALAQGGIDITEAFMKKELDEIVDQLSNPFLTVGEAEDLANDATFPLSKSRAHNRVGELVVQRREEEILDRLSKAPDLLTARRWFREEQVKDMEAHAGNQEVQQGIREQYIRSSPRILSAVAKRRLDAQAQEADRVEGEGFNIALETGPVTAVNRLKDSQFTVEVAAGDVDALHNIFLSSIDGFWKAGDNDELGVNTHVDDSVDAIDLFLEDKHISASVRAAFETKRDQILRQQQTDLNDPNKMSKLAQDREHLDVTALIALHTLEFPNTPIPQALADRSIDTATTPGRIESARLIIQNALDSGPSVSLLDLPIVKNQERMMEKVLTTDDKFDAGERALDLLTDYKQFVLLLPDDLRNKPFELLKVTSDFRKQLLDSLDDARTEEVKKEEFLETKLMESLEKARFSVLKRLGPDAVIPPLSQEFLDKIIEARRPAWNREWNDQIREAVRRAGYQPRDIVGINFKR